MATTLASIEVLGVEHVDLTVKSLERSADFYDAVLGALGFRRLADDVDNIRWANAHLTIGIRAARPEHSGSAFNRYRAGLHHLALKAHRREDVDRFYRFLVEKRITVLDAPAEYPEYGATYYAVFFADPDGMKLELVHFPWGYWRIVQSDGRDPRPRRA